MGLTTMLIRKESKGIEEIVSIPDKNDLVINKYPDNIRGLVIYLFQEFMENRITKREFLNTVNQTMNKLLSNIEEIKKIEIETEDKKCIKWS
ncbi:hypothetical protein ACFLZ0_00460 [Patescibacteria group bacterium]